MDYYLLFITNSINDRKCKFIKKNLIAWCSGIILTAVYQSFVQEWFFSFSKELSQKIMEYVNKELKYAIVF